MWRGAKWLGGAEMERMRISCAHLGASAASEHSEQPRYYRDRATAIRARLPTLQDDEVFTELYLLAAYYERLAEFAESSGSLGVFSRR
ncbi:MAG: hypothetical protein WCB10_20675 [Steroidobacteraceae bacterium]